MQGKKTHILISSIKLTRPVANLIAIGLKFRILSRNLSSHDCSSQVPESEQNRMSILHVFHFSASVLLRHRVSELTILCFIFRNSNSNSTPPVSSLAHAKNSRGCNDRPFTYVPPSALTSPGIVLMEACLMTRDTWDVTADPGSVYSPTGSTRMPPALPLLSAPMFKLTVFGGLSLVAGFRLPPQRTVKLLPA
jgi:hypothetical protein